MTEDQMIQWWLERHMSRPRTREQIEFHAQVAEKIRKDPQLAMFRRLFARHDPWTELEEKAWEEISYFYYNRRNRSLKSDRRFNCLTMEEAAD
jgi:hypothetical protein